MVMFIGLVCNAQVILRGEQLKDSARLKRAKIVAGYIEHPDTVLLVKHNPIVIMPPYRFLNQRQQQRYDKLVRNVKKVLPVAKLARHTLIETYDYLQTLPTKQAREEHIKLVEDGLKKQYTPLLRRMSKTQGKILVKLIDRECDQTGFAIAKAFVGAFRANVYQGIAFLFGQSLATHYDPAGADAEMERIVRLIESGQL